MGFGSKPFFQIFSFHLSRKPLSAPDRRKDPVPPVRFALLSPPSAILFAESSPGAGISRSDWQRTLQHDHWIRPQSVTTSPLNPHSFSQNIYKQFFIFICISLIYLVIAGHDGPGISFFYSNFKARQIDFPKSFFHLPLHPWPYVVFPGCLLQNVWGMHKHLTLYASYISRSHFYRINRDPLKNIQNFFRKEGLLFIFNPGPNTISTFWACSFFS